MKTDFCLCWWPCNQDLCCCNTTANTFQRVCPRPRRSSITKCIMNTKINTVFGKKLAIHGNVWAKTEFVFLCWRPCNPRYVTAIQLQTRFSGCLPDPTGGQSQSANEYQKQTLFSAIKLAIRGQFWAKINSFCAGGPATPDMLLQYNCKHVSVGPSPTPAGVNDPTKSSYIQIQGTTNGNENKGQSQQPAPL